MKQISREGIQRMINVTGGTGGTGGGGGSFDPAAMGIATEAWVEENYLSKAFFTRLFKAYGPAETEGDPDVEVEPNDLESDITSIEAMFGFWTQQYISALGQGSGGGGGGGGSDTLADLIDVELTNPVAGQVLKYNGTKWINSAASAGTVTSVAMSVPTGFAVTGSPITVSGVLGLSFADGYSLPTTAKQTNWDAAYSWTSVSRTTLGDYGITDAKFGTPGTDSIPITLGSTTQSVLTQHQSLANYYTKSETDGKFLTISFFRSLFRAYTSSNAEVQPNDGSTSTIASIKAMFGFWTEQYLSALGQSSGGGGGVTLNQPLQGINQAGLSAPTTAGQILVYNGTKWAYAGNISITNLTAYAGTFNSTVTAVGSFTSQGGNFIAQNGGFKVTGKDDTYVLLAGGGTKLLSEIGGGGSVVSVSINGTSYSPDANGDVNLGSGYLTGYTDTKTTAGISQSSSKLYIIGSTQTSATAGTYGTTYTNTNCYIGTDGCLYSGSTKVLTGITSTMVTTALGFTPAASSDLANYLPKSGGTMSGDINFSQASAAYNSGGVIWGNSAFIGSDVNNGLGLYAADIYLRPSSSKGSSSGLGVVINSSSVTYNGNTMWHAGNFTPSNYLPLSGGTMTGNIIFANRQTEAYNSDGLRWGTYNKIAASYSGDLGLYTYGTFYIRPDVSNGYDSGVILGRSSFTYNGNTIWHSGNFAPSNYLPLSGGTMTGSIVLPHGTYIYGAQEEYGAMLSWDGSRTIIGSIGASSTAATHLRSVTGHLTCGSGNTASYNVLDSGNYSSYIAYRNIIVAGVPKIVLAEPSYTSDIDLDSVYLQLSGGTMTGNITMSDGTLIRGSLTDSTGYAILQYISGTNLIGASGNGTTTTIATYIRSTGDNLYHRRGNTTNYSDHKIWDEGNSNLSTVSWTTANLTAYGKLIVNTTAESLTLAASSGTYNCISYTLSGQNSWSVGINSSNRYYFWNNNASSTVLYITNTGSVVAGSANGTYIQIGGARLVWDNGNNALYVVKSDGTAASFYATGAVSALGQSSSGTTYLDQATADARYLKLSGGQTMTGSFSGTSITLSSQMKSTNAVATAYLTVGTSSINTSYTLYVNGNAGIKHIVIGNEQQVNTVNCAVIQTLSSRGIYIKSGSAPNYVDGTWANASDIRLKDIVSNAGASVEQVADAPVFNYKWKAGGTQVMLGTSAQYWKNVFNFGVSEGPDSYLYMDYASIALASAVMVARKVQSHEERIAALEAENARLQKELNEIKAA